MSNVNTHHFPHRDILVVDDNRSDLKLLSGILRKAGYTVRPASDGELALRSVQARLPALILLDIQMPDLDGYEVCRRLKDSEDTRDIPVIFISVRTSLLDKVKAFGVGGVDYISKPFEPEEVLARVATHLALWKAQKEIEEKNAQLQQEIAERKRAEEELHLHAKIVANVSEDVCLTRASDDAFVYTNPKFEERFGYGHGELLGKHVSVVNAPIEKSPEEVVREILKSLEKRGTWQGEVHNIRKDGTTFWRSASVSGFEHLEHGEVWVTVGMDITERKRAEEALRESEERYRTIIESVEDGYYEVGDGSLVCDTGQRYLWLR